MRIVILCLVFECVLYSSVYCIRVRIVFKQVLYSSAYCIWMYIVFVVLHLSAYFIWVQIHFAQFLKMFLTFQFELVTEKYFELIEGLL